MTPAPRSNGRVTPRKPKPPAAERTPATEQPPEMHVLPPAMAGALIGAGTSNEAFMARVQGWIEGAGLPQRPYRLELVGYLVLTPVDQPG